ncbi:hypothetical protein [Hyphomicrobium sp. LHD-15]|uniref:hypothetical protein n=1 Tax=Hyphomicrobium sp. LHD-15 TaxID=3072142 RepID=UPI00280E1363|nr:hypothetical protein [Hyphomicrobium sp. LHD-15]MDQ8697837.1 hypothetical protein [Hyphomicrobium sp. LHD-15]
MLDRLTTQIAWHWTTATHVLRLTPVWVWIVPVVGAFVVNLLNTNAVIAPYLTKDVAEFISPIILAMALALAACLAAMKSHVFYKWQALFALALFLRELHFAGTNTGFYIAMVLLIGWASYARDFLEPFFSDRKIVTLLTAIIWTYLVSKTFDRHMWDHVLPAGTTSNLFEENLEILGHTLFLALVVVSIGTKAPASALSRNP